MSVRPIREMHADLVNPQMSAPVVLVMVNLDVTETADVTIPIFSASRKMKLINASYVHESAATAATTYTALLQNDTGSVAMSTALDIKALGAGADSLFAGVPTNNDAVLEIGEVLEIIFNETGGTVTAPDRVGIMLEFQLLT